MNTVRIRQLAVVVMLIAVALVVAAAAANFFAGTGTQGASAGTPAIPGIGASGGAKSVDGKIGREDGTVPDGGAFVSDLIPALANLSPELRDALTAASRDAEESGVSIVITSGWRSADMQKYLSSKAASDYGSSDEAARWVAAPGTSSHETGDAVDVGPMAASDWLAQFGSSYGLCQTYANESWHYEFRAEAIDAVCPATYEDATADPRRAE
ncbi:M15 family metallopeptidase [Haematomicrobium sanguinis]|uniref:M15 family metallopeptidase n=1 Tax=Haematomicrobium sanguinis TaxID=479106 RepID=UPI00047ADA92|nr:M15 family metallopeptidase [Haematomicrobium sanguinis]